MTEVDTVAEARAEGADRRGPGRRRRPRHAEARADTTVTHAVGADPHPARHRAEEPKPTAEWTSVRALLPVLAVVAVFLGGGVAATAAVVTLTSDSSEPTPSEEDPGPIALAPLAGVPAPAGPVLPVVPFDAPRPVIPGPTAAPVPPGSTRPAGLAAVVGALFDSATGSFGDKFDNNGDAGLVEGAAPPRVVDNPAAPGRSAWQFSLPAGGKRSEVLPLGPGTKPQDGDRQFVRYSAILSEDFPTDISTWQLILQWHHNSATGSPPLALQVTGGQLMMVSEGDDMKAIGPVSPGDPINLAMQITFSQDPAQSSVTVWRDGRPTGVTNWSPPNGTMSTQGAYLKMGMYRDPNVRRPGSITVTDLKIGPDARGIGGIGPRPPAAP